MIIPRARLHRLVLTTLALCASSALGQGIDSVDAGTGEVLGDSDVSQVGKIGRLHDHIRRAQQRESLYAEIAGFYADYTKWKTEVANATGFSYSMDVSLLYQWGSPNGGSPSLQTYASPGFDWTVFKSSSWGTGSFQFAYNVATYSTSQNAADTQSNLSLITPINDSPTKSHNWTQFTYTQATPSNRWEFTIGQFPLYNFDSNAYLGNQQENFNNYLFAQNGSQSYLLTGIGGYVQFNATKTVQLVAGTQGTSDPLGVNLTTKNFNHACCTQFGYAQWTPHFPGLGAAQYSIAYFNTPNNPAQPATSNWSVNAVQNLNATWAVFARANGASSHFVTQIKDSYALGVAMNNPLMRASTDQIALAVGLSSAASQPTNPPNARNEIPIEAYWTWTFFGGLLLTPAVQYISHPALNPTQEGSWAASLRLTQLF
jgi:porin